MKQGLCFIRLIGLRTFVGALCVLLVTVSGVSFGQGMWIQKAMFLGVTREAACGFSIGNKGYIGTGLYVSNLQDFWEWDQAANSWMQKANFPGTVRSHAVGFSIGNKGYIGTGGQNYNLSGPFFSDFWEWDQATNTWTQKANFGGTARFGATGFSIGKKGYIGTGWDGNFKNDFWEWDQVTNTWTQKSNFGGTGRYWAVGFSIGTKGYIGTGGSCSGPNYNDFWEWDQATNTWSQKANFGGVGRYGATGFSIGTKIYIGTGDGASCFQKNDFWEWDQATNVWTQKANYSGQQGGYRAYSIGFSIGNCGYIGTGVKNAIDFQDFWEYCPNTVAIPTIISSGSNTICLGEYTTLTVSGGGNYSWSTGDTTSSISVFPSTTSTYSVFTTNGCSCMGTNNITITVIPYPNANCSPNDTICFGKTITLFATGGTNYLWSTGETTSSVQVNPNTVTNYSVVVSNGNCSDTAYTSVSVLPSPTASVTSNISTPITYGQSATLTAGGGVSYNWNNGDNGNTITVSPTATTVYCVTATSPNNCSDTACVTVTFYDVCASGIYLPNAFSPNNDDENDFLQVYYENALCVTSLNIAIYNRLGEKVFGSTDPAFKWDGTNQGQVAGNKGRVMNTQVVTYYLKATLIDGKEISKKGNISLMR